MRFLGSLAVALSMYSKFLSPQWTGMKKNMKYAMCFFPVIGVVTGAVEYAAGYALLTWTDCGSFFFAAVMTLIPVLVTGGIHMDGFADTMDALSSYGDPGEKAGDTERPAYRGVCRHMAVRILFAERSALERGRPLRLPCGGTYVPAFRSLSGISVVSFRAAKNSGLLRTFQDGAQRRRVRVVLILWAAVCGAGMIWLSPIRAVSPSRRHSLYFCIISFSAGNSSEERQEIWRDISSRCVSLPCLRS